MKRSWAITTVTSVLLGTALWVSRVERRPHTPPRPVAHADVVRTQSEALRLIRLERALQRHDPEAAVALAELRAWAGTEPAAALAWARGLTGELRLAALIAVLEGAAKQPALAVRLASELLIDQPELAADCGTAFVGALIRREAFGAALEFARSGPNELRPAWLATLFGAWAEREPAFARELATLFGTQGGAGPAFQSVVEHWATANPAAAAAYAMDLPPGPARSAALQASVPRWAVCDPEAVVAALPRLTGPAERDTALAAIVSGTDAVNRPTQTALAWSEAITDPALRQRALAHVLLEWAQSDPAAAESYVSTATHLSAAEREALHAALQPRRVSDDL
jgi:hypothetical protein